MGISNVAYLVASIKTPPKPKTLSSDIVKNEHELVGLPNVAFSPKRVTRGDKAKAVGQYKITEEEFRKRGIEMGYLAEPPNREKAWFKGDA